MIIEEHVLFGKYRLCRKLGQGRSGTVYLAFHTQLEEYRAVKIVPKSMADYEVFRREAIFLKTLRHPGIPLVYDVEEDENSSYLIEEYLEGESLYALVKRLGGLSVKMTLDIGIQICQIIQFMNSAKNPILYLDLQPKNLLIGNGAVRLTDFDHAQYAADADTFGERYGTVGFAAPEQYRGEPLDCRTDVYAIGALLFFMCRGKPPGREPNPEETGQCDELSRIIRGCMAAEKEERYQSAKELGEALKELQEKRSEHLLNEQAHRSRIIIFAGAQQGIGTTHAALAMSNFLTRNGFPTLYQEGYDTEAVRILARNLGLRADGAGVYHIGEMNLCPYYGRSVSMPYPYFPTIIKDTGPFQKQKAMPEADFVILVCGGKWWETDRTLKAARYYKSCGRVVLLFNHVSEESSLRLPEDLKGLPCLRLPFFPNPFKGNRLTDACFKDILTMEAGGIDTWQGKKKKIRFPWKKAGL